MQHFRFGTWNRAPNALFQVLNSCFKSETVVVLTILGGFQMCNSPKYSIWYSIKTLSGQLEYPLSKYKMFHIQNILHISIKRWTPIKSCSVIYSCIILSTLIRLIFIETCLYMKFDSEFSFNLNIFPHCLIYKGMY